MIQIAEAFHEANEKNVLVGPVPLYSVFLLNFKVEEKKFRFYDEKLSKKEKKVKVLLSVAERKVEITKESIFEADIVNLGVILCPVLLSELSNWRMIKCEVRYCKKKYDDDVDDRFLFSPKLYDNLSNKKEICLTELNYVNHRFKDELDEKQKALINLLRKLIGEESISHEIKLMKDVVNELKAIQNIEEKITCTKKKNGKKVTFAENQIERKTEKNKV